MRELITKVIFIKQFLDALSYNGVAQDCIDVWTLFWIHAKHTLKQISDILAKMAGHIVILTDDDLPS